MTEVSGSYPSFVMEYVAGGCGRLREARRATGKRAYTVRRLAKKGARFVAVERLVTQ